MSSLRWGLVFCRSQVAATSSSGVTSNSVWIPPSRATAHSSEKAVAFASAGALHEHYDTVQQVGTALLREIVAGTRYAEAVGGVQRGLVAPRVRLGAGRARHQGESSASASPPRGGGARSLRRSPGSRQGC